MRAFAVGDLGNEGERDEKVAAMIAGHDPQAFLALGDIVYPEATTANMERYYEPGYGRLDEIVWPTPGNHDYLSDDDPLPGYVEYFERRAPHAPVGEQYYITELGAWHVYSLNSEIGEGAAGSEMYRWLEDRLAADDHECIAAMWHSPVYTAGRKPYDEDGMRPIYDLLVDHGADVILTGHDHNYQRWDVDGIAYFVVGTGGKSRYEIDESAEGLAFGSDLVNGALQLDLMADGARFTYRTMDDEVIDRGSIRC